MWTLVAWILLWPVGIGGPKPDAPVLRWTRVNPAIGSGTFEVYADGGWRSTTRAVAHEGTPVKGSVKAEAIEELRQALIKQRFCAIKSTHRPGAGVLENYEVLAVALPGLSCTVSIGTATRRPARVDVCLKAFRALGTASHGGGDYSGPSLPGIEALGPEPAGTVTERRITRKIERKTLEQTLADGQQVSRDVRVAPFLIAGKPAGLKLSAVREGGVIWRVGLENGDVVQSVNGLSIASPELALEAYGKLKTAIHLTIALQRAGTPMTLEVDIIP